MHDERSLSNTAQLDTRAQCANMNNQHSSEIITRLSKSPEHPQSYTHKHYGKGRKKKTFNVSQSIGSHLGTLTRPSSSPQRLRAQQHDAHVTGALPRPAQVVQTELGQCLRRKSEVQIAEMKTMKQGCRSR